MNFENNQGNVLALLLSIHPTKIREWLQRLERRQNLLSVAFDFDLAPHLGNLSGFVDQERRPLNAHVRFTVHRFLDPNSISVRRGLVFVSRKRERKLVFRLEFVMGFGTVWRNADNRGPKAFETAGEASEIFCLHGASWRVVLGIEINDDGMSLKLGQSNRRAAVAGQCEVRGWVAVIQHLVAFLSSLFIDWCSLSTTFEPREQTEQAGRST